MNTESTAVKTMTVAESATNKRSGTLIKASLNPVSPVLVPAKNAANNTMNKEALNTARRL